MPGLGSCPASKTELDRIAASPMSSLRIHAGAMCKSGGKESRPLLPIGPQAQRQSCNGHASEVCRKNDTLRRCKSTLFSKEKTDVGNMAAAPAEFPAMKPAEHRHGAPKVHHKARCGMPAGASSVRRPPRQRALQLMPDTLQQHSQFPIQGQPRCALWHDVCPDPLCECTDRKVEPINPRLTRGGGFVR